jgi:membrane-bound lytic murein transglycosylase A
MTEDRRQTKIEMSVIPANAGIVRLEANAMKLFIIPLFIVLTLAACARPPVTGPENAVSRISWWRAGAHDDDREFRDLADAVRKSLDYYGKLPPETAVRMGENAYTARDLFETLERFLTIVDSPTLTPEGKWEQIKDEFVLYRSSGSDGRGRVLFTGYYEPVLSCRLLPDGSFRFPLYRRPDDIIEVDLTQFGNGWPKDRIFGRLTGKRVVPYYSREEIEQGKVFAGKDLEILWCSDPVDIYFLQVQGSGKADLGDGTLISVLYDAQNGRPYRSIGKHLIDAGVFTKEQVTMQAIREYLRTHPEEAGEVLNQNPSYVFFRLDTGPSVGNMGVPLTPGRSIATDSRLFPRGALALIRTEQPVIGEDGAIREWVPFTRFVLNQDTGGAIRGAGRVDLFWGRGTEAGTAAGAMKQEGELYFLVRKK